MDRIPRIVGWLALGLLLGAGLGLVIGWVVWPLEYVEADPTILEDSYFDDYVVMIASAYSLEEDLSLARERLNGMGSGNVDSWYLQFTVDQILAGADETNLYFLVKLASDLGLYSPVMEPYLAAEPANKNG
jgi:hypothetical protein